MKANPESEPRHRFSFARYSFEAEHRYLGSPLERERVFQRLRFIVEVKQRLRKGEKPPSLSMLKGSLAVCIRDIVKSWPVDHREWHCAEWAERIMDAMKCASVTVGIAREVDGGIADEAEVGVTVANPLHFGGE